MENTNRLYRAENTLQNIQSVYPHMFFFFLFVIELMFRNLTRFNIVTKNPIKNIVNSISIMEQI